MAVNRDDGTDLPEAGQYPARRGRRWFWGAVLLLVLAGGLFYGGLRHSRRQAFTNRLQAIRATGCPVTLEELDRWYKWPESGANAATMVLDAADCYVAPADSNAGEVLWSVLQGHAARRSEPLRDSVRALLAEHIRVNAKPLQLLREAATTADSRYPMDMQEGIAMRLMYLGEVVNKANILPCLEAILYAENGAPPGPAQALLTAFGVTRSLAPEPMLLCQINRLTCQTMTLTALERVLSRTAGLTDAQLVALSEAVAGAHEPDGWTRALIGQRCLLVGLYEQPGLVEAPLPNSPLRRFLVNTYKSHELAPGSNLACLDFMDRLMQVRQLPPEERMSAAKALGAALDAWPKRDFIIHERMPPLVGVVRWELAEMARRRTACCALAVERYRLTQGGLPGTLEDLVPQYLAAVPQDPFDGKPLRYKHLERGYVVYSVGPDERDDGGKERPPFVKGKPDTSTYDITFTVER